MNLKKVGVFLEFLIGGIVLGVIEDVILIKVLTDEPITFSIFIIIFLVTLPFAFIGEYIVDNIDFLKIFKVNKKYKKVEIFFEFLIFGIILGVFEDLTAFYFAIGDPITFKVVLVAFAVAVPFAFIGEYLIDRISLAKIIKKFKSKKFF
ncbi:MAG: hypothetical protein ABH804_01420 [archaeon]